METIRQVQAELGGVPVDDPGVAAALDERDPLARFCDNTFVLPADSVYLCGHSLGPMPRSTPSFVNRVLEQWAEEGVLGWFSSSANFKDADKQPRAGLASLLGAAPEEVVAMASLTVNLHLLLPALYRPSPERYRIIVEEGAFPSDLHALRSHLAVVHPALAARDDVILSIPRRPGEQTWRPEDVLDFVHEHGQQAALVYLGGVHYSTGQLFDMEAITRAAHERGCLAGFDLAHAVGNVELRLHDWRVDFAIMCTYKYLSTGPGGVGALFVHEAHHAGEGQCPDRLSRLTGWWGQREQDRFTFAEPGFVPAPGALGFQISTPSPMLLATLNASLAIFAEAGGMAPIRAKSITLNAFLEALLETMLPGLVEVVTPRAADQRGCQLSMTFAGKAEAVLCGLRSEGIVADVRQPNILRVAPYPLYTSFMDVHRFVHALKRVLLA